MERVTVTLTFEIDISDRGRPGRYSGPPENCYESEPPEWELLDVADSSGSIKLEQEAVDTLAEVLSGFFDRVIDDHIEDHPDGDYEGPDEDYLDYDGPEVNTYSEPWEL